MERLINGLWWGSWLWLGIEDIRSMQLPYPALGLWTLSGMLLLFTGASSFSVARAVLSLMSLISVTLPALAAWRNKQMGGGDVYMLAVLSLVLGLEEMMVCIAVGFTLAAMVAVPALRLANVKRIPLVPFLGLGVWIAGYC